MSPASLESALIERVRVGVVVWQLADDPTHMTLVHANAAASRIGQLDFAACLGGCLREQFPVAFAQGRHRVYADVLGSGLEQTLAAGSHPELARVNVFGRLVP